MKNSMQFIVALLLLNILFASCAQKNEKDVKKENMETIEVSLKKGESFEKSLGNFGNEDGADIKQQASHYSKSEVHRGKNFMEMIYEYVPAEGYTGKDEVVISKYTGDIGDGKSGTYSYLKIEFTITE